jgi:hypothetical protein
VDHEAEDAHHRRAALVELDSQLLQLPLLGLLRPAEVEPVAEVPPEFRLAGDMVMKQISWKWKNARIWRRPAVEMESGPSMAVRPLGKLAKELPSRLMSPGM